MSMPWVFAAAAPGGEWPAGLLVVRAMVEWITSYPILSAEIALVLLLSWGWIGKGYGVQNLFWHEDRSTQFVSGFASALLFAELFAIGFLLDRDASWGPGGGELFRLVARRAPILGRHHPLGSYLVVTTVPCLVLLTMPALFRARAGREFHRIAQWPMAAGAVVGEAVVLAVALNLRPILRGARRLAFLAPRGPLDPLGQLPHQATPELSEGLRGLVVVFFAAILAIYVLLHLGPVRRRVSTIAMLCELLGLIAAIYGFFALYDGVGQLVLLLLVLATGMVSNAVPRYKLRFPNMDGCYDAGAFLLSDYPARVASNPVSLLDGESALDRWLAAAAARAAVAAGLPDAGVVLGSWRDGVAPPDGSPAPARPRVAVLACGGGANLSAVWTATVLARLEEALDDFPVNLRLIAGASGGMVGAAAYAASLTGPLRGRAASGSRDPLIDALGRDRITAIAQTLVLDDLPLHFLPLPNRHDRGIALERRLLEDLPVLGSTLPDLADGERDGWRPSLVFSPMMIEDGRRLLISNLDLPYMSASVGNFLQARQAEMMPKDPNRDVYSLSAIEFFKLFPGAYPTFRAATAARMSATFPYASPAVSLPTYPTRRVVDAGYYDNYGVEVAASWIGHHREWLRSHTSGVVLIQVRGSDSETARRRPGSEVPRDPAPGQRLGLQVARVFQELTGPIEGGESARRTLMSFRNDEQVQALSDWFDPPSRPNPSPFFTTVVFEYLGKATMDWYLTAEEKADLTGGFHPPSGAGGREDVAREVRNRNLDRLDQLARWWN